jgi:hypothetical protein
MKKREVHANNKDEKCRTWKNPVTSVIKTSMPENTRTVLSKVSL